MKGTRYGRSSTKDDYFEEQPPDQDLLGLNHLKKLTSEFADPAQQIGIEEKENKLYSMLPLFCNIFNSVHPSILLKKFPNVNEFTQAVSKLLVTEVRRRASNQSTNNAASSIASFLELNGTEEASKGWMLISTLNLLTAGGETLIEVMTGIGVPSTLIKCLYLFFDLPLADDSDMGKSDTELRHPEKRILLQKMFMQVLASLCAHTSVVEELTRKDDLTLLFSAVCSQTSVQNLMWKKTSSDILISISKNSLSLQVISMIHSKGCISLCMNSMKNVFENPLNSSTKDMLEMCFTIICFVKEASLKSTELMKEFQACQGYIFIVDFLLNLEKDYHISDEEVLQSLVNQIASLSFCGESEIEITSVCLSTSLYQLPGFRMPVSKNTGSTVKNIPSFQVLQSILLRSQSSLLAGAAIDAISTVFHADDANFFILQNQHTLSQVAEKLPEKPVEVQRKFFKVIEFLVFELKYIPTKELIGISLILKSKKNMNCCAISMQFLLSILRYDPIFKNVFRELGMVEVLVCCLSLYAKYASTEFMALKDQIITNSSDTMENFGEGVVATVKELLTGSPNNICIFRELGGSSLVKELVICKETRQKGLELYQQLITSSSPEGEEDMLGLLEMMPITSKSELDLSSSVFHCLIKCLKESHRCRTIFRRIGGFMYVLSTLQSLEGVLDIRYANTDINPEKDRFFSLIELIFSTFAVAMRFEPANALFFQEEMSQSTFLEAIIKIGCFQRDIQEGKEVPKIVDNNIVQQLKTIFMSNTGREAVTDIPEYEKSCCRMFRMLYELAIDSKIDCCGTKPINRFRNESNTEESLNNRICFLDLSPRQPVPVIVHGSLLITMLKIVFYLENRSVSSHLVALQHFFMETISLLMSNEKNQQIIANTGFVDELFELGSCVLKNEFHFLHSACINIFQKLASQKLTTKTLRKYLRLVTSSAPDPDVKISRDSVANTTLAQYRMSLPLIKAFVKMIINNEEKPEIPPFIEFDMSKEGFGCLFIPCLTRKVINQTINGMNSLSDLSNGSGINRSDRIFPPTHGFSYSTWISVEKFSDPRLDPHPIRLLTLVKSIKSGTEQNTVYLSIVLSARDKAIIVSVQETDIENVNDWQPDFNGEWGTRLWFPDIIKEGEWHHLAFVFHRQMVKNSYLTIYINGVNAIEAKMNYVSQNSLSVSSMYGVIGTMPAWRKQSKLLWKQGPCLFLEEAINADLVKYIYLLGCKYVGTLQAPQLPERKDNSMPLMSEEKVFFGLNAVASTRMTLSKIRKIYSKYDSKVIAKQLGMTTQDNSTPLYVVHNSAGHLAGPGRPLGAVVVGYLGARIFCTQPVTDAIQTIGGCKVLLGLVALSSDVDSLCECIKAIKRVLLACPAISSEMEYIHGYQMLAMLLKRKSFPMTLDLLTLVLTLFKRDSTPSQYNELALKYLVCDLEIWCKGSPELMRTFLKQFQWILYYSGCPNVISILSENEFIEKCLSIFDINDIISVNILSEVISFMLRSSSSEHLRFFSQFTASTLHLNGKDENDVNYEIGMNNLELCSNAEKSCSNIVLRNRCLKLFLSLFYSNGKVNHNQSVELMNHIGFDWILIFLNPKVHSSSVIWALKILNALLSVPTLSGHFREGTLNGGWFIQSQFDIQKEINIAFNQTETSQETSTITYMNNMLTIPGFQCLDLLMKHHATIPEVYNSLLSMVTGKFNEDHPRLAGYDIESEVNYLFGPEPEIGLKKTKIEASLCGEAIRTILSLIRVLLNNQENTYNHPHILQDIPDKMIEIFTCIYQESRDQSFFSHHFLTALIGTLFPIQNYDQSSHQDGILDQVLRVSGTVKDKVMNLIYMILMDSLILPLESKHCPVIDMILDVEPENSSCSDQHRFQREFLSYLVEQLLSVELLREQPFRIPISGGDFQSVVINVMYLASRIVDKLWLDFLPTNPRNVHVLILKLVILFKEKEQVTALSNSTILVCLNRTILYMFSHPIKETDDLVMIDNILEDIFVHRNMIMGDDNSEDEFFICLIFCLLQFSEGLEIPSSSFLSEINSFTENTYNFNSLTINDKSRLTKSSNQIWYELLKCKKDVIEFLIQTTLESANTIPSLESMRKLLLPPSFKSWCEYVQTERKYSTQRMHIWEIQNNFQSRFQKVAGGLTGGLKMLASGSNPVKFKREDKIKPSRIDFSEILQFVDKIVIIIADQFVKSVTQRKRSEQHDLNNVEERWCSIQSELIRERGVWGPDKDTPLTKWQLDMTEGPLRMRKRTLKDFQFFIRYPCRDSDGTEKSLKYKRPTSLDSILWFEKCNDITLFHRIEAIKSLNYDDLFLAADANLLPIDEQIKDIRFRKKSLGDNTSEHDAENGTEMDDSVDLLDKNFQNFDGIEENSLEYQNLMRLLDKAEKISLMIRCAKIHGLDTTEGLLLFGSDHFYVVDGFTLINQKDIHDIDFLDNDQFESIIPTVPGQLPKSKPKREISKILYEDVTEVHKRRYLLQPIAVELFLRSGKNYLLAFQRCDRIKIHQKFSQIVNDLFENKTHSIAGQGCSSSIEQTSGLFSNLISETSVTQKWVKGELSNFQYLMNLNTLAGRSYNDLMQYPIFPWVLADYASEELDMSDPKTFRDLSKPMGAQNAERLEQYKKRYQEWDGAGTDTPPYFYGTHYSSAMIVCSYLVRMEPFTQHFLRLQGGHFDLADRMFHSLQEAWESASKNNMADVRELIPEFFYLPDFLINSNNFDLGTKQSGERLHDVRLPPWAKNDALEFVRVHREALESDYVSSNLHKWIDLIFGFKQQGDAATESWNTFHHLFYEGNVDIFNIEDPLQKNATIGFINNFGQIPKQLFKKAHPQRKGLNPSYSNNGSGMTSVKAFFNNLANLKPSMKPVKTLKGPVGEIFHTERNIYAVEQNKIFVPGSCNRYLAWGFSDQSFRIGCYDTDKVVFVCEPKNLIGEVLSCTCPNPRLVLTAGTSSVVSVWFYDSKNKQLNHRHSLYGHNDAVICLASSPSWGIAVSGSRDATVIIWDISKFSYVKSLHGHSGPVTAVSINEANGNIVTCSSSFLYLWNVNGVPIAEVNTLMYVKEESKKFQILCVAQSHVTDWDKQNVIITGGSDGIVRMFSLDYNEVKREISSKCDEISPAESTENGLSQVMKKNEAKMNANEVLDPKGDGYTWIRELVFRGQLTMHTSFERPDNSDPASITALSFSKDHKTLLVGDERGRVFSWIGSNKPGKGFVDHWVKDETDQQCKACGVSFTIYERKHHCRKCGKLFCSSCSRYKAKIPELEIHQAVRVCSSCHSQLL